MLVAALVWLCAQAAWADGPEADLADFVDWFPGRYDSALQVVEQRAAKLPAEQRNYRRHSIFRRVDLPAFGEHVYYAEQYRDGDPDAVYRQRIYVITIDPNRKQLRLRVHIPPDTRVLLGAYREPTLLSGLRPEDTTVWPGCDLFWTREGDQLVGRLDAGACSFESARFGQRVFLEEDLTLSRDSIWFADRGLTANGEYLFGMRGDEPTIAIKVRPFVCTFSDGSSAWVHDQGGTVLRLGFRWTLQRHGPGDARGLQLHIRNDRFGHASSHDRDADSIAQSVRLRGVAERFVQCRLQRDAVYDDGRTSQRSPRRVTRLGRDNTAS